MARASSQNGSMGVTILHPDNIDNNKEDNKADNKKINLSIRPSVAREEKDFSDKREKKKCYRTNKGKG